MGKAPSSRAFSAFFAWQQRPFQSCVSNGRASAWSACLQWISKTVPKNAGSPGPIIHSPSLTILSAHKSSNQWRREGELLIALILRRTDSKKLSAKISISGKTSSADYRGTHRINHAIEYDSRRARGLSSSSSLFGGIASLLKDIDFRIIFWKFPSVFSVYHLLPLP